ncbi:MAG: hypothetical protein WC558_16185 [Patulibacter sp.]
METLRARIRRRHLFIVVGALVLVVVIGQLLLPPIASRVARGELSDDRARVDIKALPAWKLVFGHVDELRVVTPTLRVNDDDLTSLLQRAKKIDKGRITIGTLNVEGVPIPLRDVRATLDGGRVEASARITISELAAELPAGAEVVPEPPHPDGQPRLRASLELFGAKAEVPIVVRARGGVLEAAGDSGIASAIRITLFQNEALRIDGLQGAVDGDVMTVRVRATLR